MSRANSPPNPETTHLVSLVLHSKKALQHGEQLCAQAHELMRTASELATDVLALDAKVHWVSQGIQEQLKVRFCVIYWFGLSLRSSIRKLATSVSRSLEMQSNRLINKAKVGIHINHSPRLISDVTVKEWDKARSFHSGNLDSILETLEKQLVPPDFHLSSSDSSLFGSQHSDDVPNGFLNETQADVNGRHKDRSRWKNLRDFVDFGAIMKATEDMDDDRDTLDVSLDILPSYETLTVFVGNPC